MARLPAERSRPPRVTVVVPVWNSGRWLGGCLESLAGQELRDFATLLVDNGSTDGSVEAARRDFPGVEVLRFDANRGFAAAANAGIRASRSPYVALLNADTRVESGWLAELVAALDAAPPEVASVASLMLRLDDPRLVDDAGDGFSWYGSASKRGHGRPAADYDEPAEVLSACAGAALYRRRLFDAVGPFDERFESYLEDVDLGLRARLSGYRCRLAPAARVLHAGHGSALARGRYVTLVTRNRLLVLWKNIPARLLLRHAGTLLAGQLYFLVAYRRPWRSLAGYAGAVARLPHAWRERRRIQGARRISLAELDGALSPRLGEPPLGRLLRDRLRRSASAATPGSG